MSFTDTQAGPSTRSDLAPQRGQAVDASIDPPVERPTIGGVRMPRLGHVIWGLVAAALVLRLWELGERAMHHDESLDAWWSWRFRNGQYDGYDPVYHGPLRFYITAGFYEIFGESEATARLFSALTGTAAVGLPWYLRRELKYVGTVTAAFALALSPTMLYYSRFGREDAQMVFLALLAMVLGLSYLRRPRVLTATALAFSLVCSFAIKESTYLFGLLLAVYLLVMIAAQFEAQHRGSTQLSAAFVNAGLGLATIGLLIAVIIGSASDELFPMLALYMVAMVGFTFAAALPRLRGRADDDQFEWPSTFRSIGSIGWAGWVIALGTFAFFWVMFFTVFFRFPGDWASGFTKAIDYWDSQQEVNRGGQPWYYYLYALPVYEWAFVLLAFVGGWRGLRRPTNMSVLMVWFAVGSLILYSYAGERMPWLIAHPLLPILILAAMGAQHLWEHRDRALMPGVGAAVVLALLLTTGTSIRSSFPNGADSREILSQAGQATPHLTAALERLSNIDEIAVRETGQPARLAIGTENAWPYSWYLRDRGNVTWFTSTDGPPLDGSVDVIIIDRSTADLALYPEYQATLFAMRSWWVPTYTDAGPLGWLSYMRSRDLWEQNPNPNFLGVREAVEDEGGGIGDTLAALQDGANAKADGWVGFVVGADDPLPEPVDPNAFVEEDDGLDGCGSVDQWFLVHNRFAFSEAVVYPEPIDAMGTLPCVSDSLAERATG